MAITRPIEELTIAQAHEAFLSGEFTAEDLVGAYLDRIERIDRTGPELNSVISVSRSALVSASATTERVRALEAQGVISGYRAVVDLEKVGYPVLAVVRLKYPGNHHQPLRRLLADRREILECLRTTGDDCYTLKVAATSMGHLEALMDELAGFGSTTTSVVYSQTLPYRGPERPERPGNPAAL